MKNIVFDHVVKAYDKNVIVKDLNMEIREGERLILLGPSGCGKSTTLRMIAGLERLSGGNLYMDGRLVNDVPCGERNVSMVFQNYALFPHMTVQSNIVYGLKAHKMDPAEIKTRLSEVLDMLDLKGLEERRPKDLSGGQRQRVALARAVVKRSDYFLLDEPLSNLDAQLRLRARKELVKIHEMYHQTLIYVTHDQVEAMTLGTRIVVMNRGMIQQVAPPAELYRNPVNKFVAGFIGSPTMNFLDVDVLEEDGTVWLLGQGWRLPLEGYQASKLKDKGYTGKRITLGIRPEDLHQEECSRKNGSDGLNGNDSGWIGVYISVREMLGSEVLLHGNTGDTGQLSARMPASCRVKPGEFLRLYVDMPQIKLFDVQSEENILFD